MTSCVDDLSSRRRRPVADLRRKPEPTLYPIAVLGGLIGLFVADARANGLTGGEGFLVGFLATLVVLILVIAVDGRRNASWLLSKARAIVSETRHILFAVTARPLAFAGLAFTIVIQKGVAAFFTLGYFAAAATVAGLFFVFLFTFLGSLAHLFSDARMEMAESPIEPATIEHIEGTDISRVILTTKAAERLGIETATVEETEVVRKRRPGGEVVPTPADMVTGLNAVWVRVPLNESDLQKVDRSQPAIVLSSDGAEAGVLAQPIEAPAVGDRTEPPSALYYVVEGAKQKWLPGQRVRVETPLAGGGTQKVVPYSAVIYGAHGETWVYTSPEPLTFVRHPITVDYVEGDMAVLSEGPPAGTEVATVGVPELFGAEFRCEWQVRKRKNAQLKGC